MNEWLNYDYTKRVRGTLHRQAELRLRLGRNPYDGRQKFRSRTRGKSMVPTINPGDEVVTDVGFDIGQMGVGDIATYIHDNRDGSEAYWTHRVVGVYGNELVTKGDGNPRRDRYRVTRDEFIGKVVDFGPAIGTSIGSE